jgi:hypothetical protein
LSRRVTLPGADELFRATGGLGRAEEEAAPAEAPGAPVALARVAGEARRQAVSQKPTGRQRHDEKITVYVSPEELVEIERARLNLRASHGLGVDRGRIVREAVAVVLADLESKGEDSILVRRLRNL